MPAELNRPAPGALFRSDPGHLQPRSPDGRIIKYRQLISAIACLLPVAVLAGPKNGQVVAGEASISTPDANTTVIRQSTDKSVINWQSFSIGSQEYVKFVQPDKSSLSLNRVIGGNPSSILGKLSANGQVYLVNPNGIYFGQGAEVDVSGIVASVLDISNTDFMNENFVFQGDADANLGKVINDGIINARNEGFVVLLGDYSENNGVIQAHMGKVVLASGSHITMDISGNNLISVAVNEATVNELAGVKNTGDIYADGGRVIMTAKVADNLIGSAVNNQGLVRASSIVEQDGAIFLTASGGNITNSGTLDASAIVGSNADGGGVLVYTDKNITLASGGAINARGDGSGAGGVVRVIAEDRLDFQEGAAIAVAGAPRRGGFVEVSGHRGLAISGDVDTGSGGQLLIDPGILTITNSNSSPGFTTGGTSTNGFVGKGYVETQLNANTNVTLVASGTIRTAGGSLGGNFYTISATGSGDLSLVNGTVAGGGTFGACSLTGVCLPGGGTASVIQGPTGDINMGLVSINIGGALTIAAGSTAGNATVRGINAGGNVSITAGGNVNLQGNVSGAGSSLVVSAGGDIAINGSIGIGTNSGLLPLAANVSMNAGNDIDVRGDIVVGNNNLNLFADAGVPDGAGDVNINTRASCSDGCFGEPRTVTTQGAMNIGGVNFNVNGGDFGSSFAPGNFQIPVLVSADDDIAATTTDNLTVNLTGKMTLQAGKVNTRNAVDVSVKVSAGNDVSIVAPGGLSVLGGTAIASTTNANFGSATVTADATLNAGRDMTVTIARGNLLVQGGNATAIASASSTFYSADAFADANANLTAVGNLDVVTVGGSLTVAGGAAAANVIDVNTFGCGSGCTVTANANASVTASNVTVTNVGTTLSVTGGTAQAAVSGSIASSAFASAKANATINASTQNVTLNATGAINLNTAGQALANGNWNVLGLSDTVGTFAQANVTISAANNVVVTAGTGLTASGGVATATPGFLFGTGSATASARLDITAGNNANLNVLTGSFVANIGVTNAGTTTLPNVITADASVLINAVAGLSITASNNITGNSADLSGAGVFVSATNNVNLTNTTTTVGSGTAPGISGDSLLLDIMDKEGIGLPANNNPNAMFEAGGSMITGDVNMTASNGYLWFSADQLTVGSISAPAGPLLVQYSPFTPTSDIGFENSPSSLQSVNYDNSNHVTSLPMTTVAIGSAQQSGPIAVGASGTIDIGARNIIFLTTPDNVNSTANVITTGIVATSGFVGSVREEVFVGSAREEGFVTPRLDNFQVETESWWLEAERRKQQLIEERATDNGMCIAL